MARSTTPRARTKKRDFFFGTSPDLPRIVEIELMEIRSNPDQPRKIFDEQSLRELAASIEQHGLVQPVCVRKAEDGGGYFLVAGERRFRAHQMLNKSTIAAIVTKGNPDEISLIENIQREDLTPLEEAEAMARMMERHGYTQEELARVIGKARPTVTKILKLNDLPEQVKAECATSHVASKSLLLEVAHLPSAEEQLAFWESVKGSRITVRAAREKKETGEVRGDHVAVERAVAVGRSFVRKMQRIPPRELVEHRAYYDELIKLRQQIDEMIEACRQEHESLAHA